MSEADPAEARIGAIGAGQAGAERAAHPAGAHKALG